ncbi:MAG: hypothetical protein A3C11_01875 [Candidatus Sungbacteria bacterium RIFCSPHIGHO2_02_FULL_49_12]|uniref:Uncharacterized protein n=1 Tax=Candidatus Sungbacteria bacterium RIFCSPHIGHO2_02_FULL_49_12 TaxID=1802271 RepID=A0A1G2KMF7_9BACT|nr:MAG: hypothetical protein A3C11_01875 [Candidatus Sungbacteria bacterium RIFCSPHIGHO2_02_FULL_49_12]
MLLSGFITRRNIAHLLMPRFIVVAGAFILVFFLPLWVVAQGSYDPPISANTILDVVKVLVKFATDIIIPLSALFIIVAAFLYMTSGGSEQRVSQAHRALTYGVVGLVIVTSAQFLIDFALGIGSGASQASTFAEFLYTLVNAFGTILMAVSVLMVLYSAFLFMTGGGDEKKITLAKRALTFALVGVAVALLAFAIPALVKSILPLPPPRP